MRVFFNLDYKGKEIFKNSWFLYLYFIKLSIPQPITGCHGSKPVLAHSCTFSLTLNISF
jgi:hypothetical protein